MQELNTNDEVVINIPFADIPYQIGKVTKVTKLCFAVQLNGKKVTFLKRTLKVWGAYEYGRFEKQIVTNGWGRDATFATAKDAIDLNNEAKTQKRHNLLAGKLEDTKWQYQHIETLEKIADLIGLEIE